MVEKTYRLCCSRQSIILRDTIANNISYGLDNVSKDDIIDAANSIL